MPRKQSTTITLRMSASEGEWTAIADEVPGLEVNHLLPSVCVNTLAETLREHYGNSELHIEYAVTISPRFQKMLDELRANERAHAALSAAIEQGYQEIAQGLTQARLKQYDIAEVLGVSQSHVNRLIKSSATGTGTRPVPRSPSAKKGAGRPRGS